MTQENLDIEEEFEDETEQERQIRIQDDKWLDETFWEGN